MLPKVKFQIEQVALFTISSQRARELLSALGLNEWVHDDVTAHGHVFGTTMDEDEPSVGHLAFNYQAGQGEWSQNAVGGAAYKPLELELLDYHSGDNWMERNIEGGYVSQETGAVSHLGMHVTEDQLRDFDLIFREYDIQQAQAVTTTAHTNPHIKDSRRYKYVIYDTRTILGVDLKFIVRLPYSPK